MGGMSSSSTVWVDIFEELKFREYQYKLDYKIFEDFKFTSCALQYIACCAHVVIVSSWKDDPFNGQGILRLVYKEIWEAYMILFQS